MEKVKLYDFFGNYPKKTCGYVVFSSYSKKNGDMWIFRENVEKMEF